MDTKKLQLEKMKNDEPNSQTSYFFWLITKEITENRGISPYRDLKETFGLRRGLNPHNRR